MLNLLKKITDLKLLDQPVAKHTLLIDEKMKTHGALFFVEIQGRTYKIMVPAPAHEQLLAQQPLPVKKLLDCKDAMLLQ